MTLKYKIQFLDYWHLGSGLSAGAKLDSLVIKDRDDLPYAPGKTLKGLIKEMAELLEDKDFIQECFGDEGVKQGACYFSNGTLGIQERNEIKTNRLQNQLYHTIASTKIEKNGIAKDASLREIEVTIPLTLNATIENIPQQYGESIKKASAMIKRMGLNRNRGLGRCTIEGILS